MLFSATDLLIAFALGSICGYLIASVYTAYERQCKYEYAKECAKLQVNSVYVRDNNDNA